MRGRAHHARPRTTCEIATLPVWLPVLVGCLSCDVAHAPVGSRQPGFIFWLPERLSRPPRKPIYPAQPNAPPGQLQ